MSLVLEAHFSAGSTPLLEKYGTLILHYLVYMCRMYLLMCPKVYDVS